MVHILFPCQLDAKDPGKEAIDPGCGAWSDQMARTETLDPGEEPLTDDRYWTLLVQEKLTVLSYQGFKATGYRSRLD